MWETALAFAIWGSYGTVLAAAHIDPALTAIARSAGLGLLLTIASVAIARLRGPREITAAIPWRSGALWLSGAVLLVDEVLYSVSAVSGPVAIIGLAYGCVPLLALLIVLGAVSLGGPGHAEMVRRSLEAGAVNAVAFTLTPFYLWYRGIARCGVARTSICAFAEPLVATLFSLLVLKDAPATPALVAGVALVLFAIGVSTRSGD